MGYSTSFTGKFKIQPPLNKDQISYINAFCDSRRWRRDNEKLENMPDPLREAVGLPLGKEGEFFVGGAGVLGQGRDLSVLDFNIQPSTQPSLWCDWMVGENGDYLEWNGSEKFYSYTRWIEYINLNFFDKWGVGIYGSIEWEGEDSEDRGIIIANKNKITTYEGEDYDNYLNHLKLKKMAEKEKKDIIKNLSDDDLLINISKKSKNPKF